MEYLLRELIECRNTDMIDKTKCSVTAKNIYNYIVLKYSETKKEISWNDTLFNDFINLEQFINIDKSNKIFYAYYDHITGHTSHYFIMIFNSTGSFIILQSAVFEYSIIEWIEKDNDDNDDDIDDDIDDDRREYYELMRNKQLEGKKNTKTRIKNSKTICNKEFIDSLTFLEGSWKGNCEEKCEIFTKLFACNMSPEIYSQLFNNEDKIAEFRFRYTRHIIN